MSTSTHGIRELHNRTSELLALVSSGETIVVTNHGAPIARIVPYADDSLAQWLSSIDAVEPVNTGHLDELLRGKADEAATAADREDRLWG